jgi:hypothetical protein
MDQAIDTLFQRDESPKVGEIAHFAFDDRSDGVTFISGGPRTGFHLLHSKRDALFLLVDAQDYGLDHIPDIDDFRRMFDALRPGHLRDVDQPFNPLLQFHKGAIIGDANDLATYLRTFGIFLVDLDPRIGSDLLQPERNALVVAIIF